MRLFVGFRPSAQALVHLSGAVARIMPTAPELRWTPLERWHVTLVFLGEVDPDRVERLSEAFDAVAAAHVPVPDLHLAGSGTFGGALWVGVHPVLQAKGALQGPHVPEERLVRAQEAEAVNSARICCI